MREVGPQRSHRNDEIGPPQQFFVVVLRKNLPSLQDGLEGNGGRSFHDDAVPELLTKLVLVAPVTVPAGEVVVSHQQCHREGREGGPRHGQVGGAPHDLADKLRVPGDPNDPRLPQMQLRFLDGGDLLEVENAGIQKEKAQEIDRPGDSVGHVVLAQVVKLVPVVGVRNKVGDPRIRQAQTRKGKDDPPGPGADDFFAKGPGRRQPAVDERENDSKGNGHQVGVSSGHGFEGVQKVVGVPRRGDDPQDGDRREDGGDGGAKGEPSRLAERPPFFCLDVKDAGVLADNGWISRVGGRPPIGIEGFCEKGNARQIVGGLGGR